MSRQLPTLKPREVIRALERAGFLHLRVKGSHHYFNHPGRPELLVCVPVHPGDLKRPVLRAILRQADLTVDHSSICCDRRQRRTDRDVDSPCIQARGARPGMPDIIGPRVDFTPDISTNGELQVAKVRFKE